MNDPDGTWADPQPGEVHYRGVRIPAGNFLGEGGAFVLAQQRLGPGRIHHCMRWLGVSRRAFDVLCERAGRHERSTAGQLAGQADRARTGSRIWPSATECAPGSVTLQAAWKIDRSGVEDAR